MVLPFHCLSQPPRNRPYILSSPRVSQEAVRGRNDSLSFTLEKKTVALKIARHLLKVTELMGEADPRLPYSGSRACLPHRPTHTWNPAGHCQHAAVPRPTPPWTSNASHLATSQMGPMERHMLLVVPGLLI